MNLNRSPTEVLEDLLARSICAVQVAAVLEDREGIFATGWNSMGPQGLGQHAEVHAMLRANPKRLSGATLWVSARRQRNKKIVTARPCGACQAAIWQVHRVIYRCSEGKWRLL